MKDYYYTLIYSLKNIQQKNIFIDYTLNIKGII